MAQLIEKEPKMLGKVMSHMDKIDAVEVLADGRVLHKTLKKSKQSGNSETLQPREWRDVETFKNWRAKHMHDRQIWFREKLTPLQYYVTQGKGHERPFTGDLWWMKDVGMYHCACCN